MKCENGIYCFGFFDNELYGWDATDTIDEMGLYTNTIEKGKVIKHIETLPLALMCSLGKSKDVFTGEEFPAGFYDDGQFRFTTDFLRYYKQGKVGLPYEYEEYLKGIL